MNNNKFKVNINKKVNNPELWEIVTHGGHGQNSDNYPCDIIVENKVDNLWHWRRILPDMTIGEIEKGEVDFYKSYNNYNRIINSDKGKPCVDYVIPLKRIKFNIDNSNFDNNSPIF